MHLISDCKDRGKQHSGHFLFSFCLSMCFGAMCSTHGAQVGRKEQTGGGVYSDEAVPTELLVLLCLRTDV